MNAQDSRKLIVAISMAAVVGVGVMTYAMRPHPVVPVAQAIAPPAPLEEIPPTPAAVAIAPVAAAPSVAVTRHVAAANSEVSATYDTVTPKAAMPDLGMAAAADSASTPAATPAFTPSPSAAADLKVDPSAPVAAAVITTDSQITSEVKSAFAVDSVVKDVTIGVSTTNGVVALTGSLASQDAVEHVKIVVASVKDVKSVDTSALIVRNL